MKCSNCGTENNSLAMFCRKCGAKVSGGDAATFRPERQKDPTLIDPNVQQGLQPNVPPVAGAKGKTVVDPNVAQGTSPVRPGAKGRTVIDSGAAPDNSGAQAPGGGFGGLGIAAPADRRLVGFIVSYSLEPMGRFFPLYEGRVKIGSDPAAADLVIDRAKDSQISGTHALLLYRRGILTLRDQDSSNGTFVDTGTVDQETYPELYSGTGAANIKNGVFGEKSVSLMEVEDERIVLRDNSFFMIGTTLFKVKLVD